jgi:transposase
MRPVLSVRGDMAMMLTAQVSPCFVDMRRSVRACVSLEATMRELGSSGTKAHVLNLSIDGFMAETDGCFTTGSYIWIKLPGVGPISAKVIWSRGGRVGGRFTAPLFPEDHHSLTAA